MTVKIYCDICGKEIPEAALDEGEDVGNLNVGWGPWGEKATETYFDFDALCRKCTNDIKEAIERRIETIKVTQATIAKAESSGG